MMLPTTLESWFRLALTLAAIAHFCVLMAGVQVPRRLEWGTELPKLSNFNRKLFTVYLGYIGGLIVSFGALTLWLREEMLRGDRAALALAGLIGLFWATRVVVDATYFSHDDWPKGRSPRCLRPPSMNRAPARQTRPPWPPCRFLHRGSRGSCAETLPALLPTRIHRVRDTTFVGAQMPGQSCHSDIGWWPTCL